MTSRGVPHFVRQPLPWFRDNVQAHSPLNLRRGVPHFVRQPLPWFRDSAQAHSPLNLRRGAAERARASRFALQGNGGDVAQNPVGVSETTQKYEPAYPS